MRAFDVFFFLFATFVFPDVSADPWKNLQQGDQLAQQFLNQSNQKQKEAGNNPFYSGIPNESKLSDKQLEGRTQNVAQKSEVKQMIVESANKRPQFTLDPLKDPLMTGSQKILEKPLQAIGGEETRANSTPGKTTTEALTCEEARDSFPETCTTQVVVPVTKITTRKEQAGSIHFWMPAGKKKYIHLSCGALRNNIQSAYQTAGNITAAYKSCMQELGNKSSGSHITISPLGVSTDKILEIKVNSHVLQRRRGLSRRRFQVNCSGLTYNHIGHKKSWYDCTAQITTVYEEDSYREEPDEEVLHCKHLEERVRLGLCSYQSKTCSQGKQTRVINGHPVTRDCWQYTLTYACESPSKNDCGPLRARGCIQTNSVCKQYVGKICTVNTQTYTCTGNSQPTHSITGGQTPFCLDGNCRDQSWETNDEMMTSIAQLSILKEMQGQIGKNLTVFKGADNRCAKYILNFKDCCGAGKGWGKGLGLSTCSKGEKELNEKRKKRLCHYVGSYCSKKAPITKTCLKKEYTYCCFNNKLLKAFHEQGRQQINLGWGDAKSPLCRGFTVQELQRIDFSKLDLREVFEELMQKFQTGKKKSNAPVMGKHIGERMETIKKGLVPPNQKQPKQRKKGA
ncbi:MAG: conjugal transfer protein TraN [Alphaproteobacteria bacterium]|nr:conjugal transfer protein TraN [Alphaproteobacteria bacterium]